VFHQIAELGSEDYRENVDGEKEIDSGGMPGAIGRTEGATRNDVMDMGMILQGSSPGVKDAEEAWEIGPDVLLIKGELFDRRRRGLEQSRVTQALVLAHERTQLLRNGKRDQEVMAWELALDLGLEPLLGLVVLASGAVAITAGAKELARLGAAVALIERDPAGLGATSDDGIDDFAVGLGHCGSIALKILGAESGKDFMDGGRDRVPP
jgi:hypothetical protein